MFLLIDGSESKSKVTNVDKRMEQPNAIDLRLERVFEIDNFTPFVLNEKSDIKIIRSTREIYPDELGNFKFKTGCDYQLEFNHGVEIAEGECGWVIARSTLNRNGVFITSGLFDSGFKTNYLGAVLHNYIGQTHIGKGTRVGQFVLAKAECRNLYDGQYQNK